jgi:uncharacterized protein GlcG (DUF336 family)
MQFDVARVVLDASIAKARQIGVPVSIVVVDEGGHMMSMARMDGARFLTVEIAYGKAYGCIGFHRTGEEVMKFGQTAPAFVSALATASNGRFFAALGSIRVVQNGQEVGAVGVSGGSGEQDHEIAQAGVDAVK